jgi:hypothetical protein
MSLPTPNSSPSPSREPGRFKAALRGGGWPGFLVVLFVLAVTYFFGTQIGGPVVLLWASVRGTAAGVILAVAGVGVVAFVIWLSTDPIQFSD